MNHDSQGLEIITTTAAVVASCARCEAQSKPLAPSEVQAWADRHRAAHEAEDMRAWMEENGHKARRVVHWVDQDDSSGHSECECGWKSRSAKTCWLDDMIASHHQKIWADRQ